MGSSVERFLQTTGGASKPVSSDTATGQFLDNADQRTRLQTATQLGEQDPMRASRVLKMEAKTGLPEDLISRNLDQIETETNRTDFDPDAYRRTSPIVASWLAEHPQHLAAASEDLTKLGWLERQWRNVKDQFNGGVAMNELWDIGEKALRGTITPADRKRQAELEATMQKSTPEDYGLTGLQKVPGAMANQLPVFGAFLKSQAEGAGLGAAAGAGVGAAAGAGAAAIAGAVTGPGEAVAIPAGAAAGALPGAEEGAKLGWRLGTGVAAARMEASLSYLEFEKLRDANGNPLPRNVMLGASMVDGLINGGLMTVGFESVVKSVPGLSQLTGPSLRRALQSPTVGRALATYLGHIGEAAATMGVVGFLQSMVRSSAGEVATMESDKSISTLSPMAVLDRLFADQHLAAAKESAENLMMGGTGLAAAFGAVGFSGDVARIRRAEASRDAMNALSTATVDSKMMARLPDKMQEVVQRLSRDGGTETLYAPIEKWKEYWQSKQLDPAQAAEAVLGKDGAETYVEADRTGGDLPIPTGRYAATIAPTEHHAFFADELRAGPNELSAREARELVQQMDTESQVKEESSVKDRKTSASKVAENVQGQLVQAGFDERTAKTYSTLYQDFFHRLSERTGETPEALFDKFGLKIGRAADDEAVPKSDELAMEQDMDPALKGQIDLQVHDGEDDDPRQRLFAAFKKPNGNVFPGGVEAELHADEKVAQIRGSELPPELRNQGIGTALYRSVIDEAHRRGYRVFSDVDVSPDAGRVYDALAKRGYPIVEGPEHPAFESPMFEVKPYDPNFDQTRPDVLEQAKKKVVMSSDPINELLGGFHSKAERTIETKMGGRASIDEVRALLREVKEEERRWSGIDEFLEEQAITDTKGTPFEGQEIKDYTRKVSKEAVLASLRAGRVKLVEVERQPGGDDAMYDAQRESVHEELRTQINQVVRSMTISFNENDKMWEASADEEAYNAASGGETQIHSTVIDAIDQLIEDGKLSVEAQNHRTAMRLIREKIFDELRDDDQIYEDLADSGIGDEETMDAKGYEEYTLPGGTNYREFLLELPDLDPGFDSQHFEGVKNIVVHFRTKDRVDADGGKMLFVEEVQSDWHQAGREQGYLKPPAEKLTKLPDGYELKKDNGDWFLFINNEEAKFLQSTKKSEALDEALDYLNKGFTDSDSAVSNAPFTTTWHELAMKRVLRKAAEEGYDSIGWTTGNQQADRYSLDKVASHIIYSEKTHTLWTMRDNRIQSSHTVEPNRLADFVGADVAQRLMQSPMNQRPEIHLHGSEGELLLDSRLKDRDLSRMFMLQGEQLRVGSGGGMRAFYDEMIPKFLKKFVKKYGAPVGETRIENPEGNSSRFSVEHQRSTNLEVENWRISDVLGKEFEGDVFPSRESAEAAIKRFRLADGSLEVHHLKLTPELKRAALDNEFTLYQGDWKHRAVRAVFTGSVTPSFAIHDIRSFALAEFVENYGLDPEELKDIHLVINRNTKPGEKPYRMTVLHTKPTYNNLDMFTGTAEDLKHPLPLGHEAFNTPEEVENHVKQLGFAPVDYRQSIRGQLLTQARNEITALMRDPTTNPQVLKNMQYMLDIINRGSEEDIKALRGGILSSSEAERQAVTERTPSLFDLAEFLQSGDEPRGRIRIGASGINIELLKSADLSTFIHESAHFFLEVMQELGPEHAEVGQDLQTIRDWVGHEGDAAFGREEHELFARGFERYLLEGKAPVARLQAVFARFKAWLTNIYRSVSELNVPMTDEVRGVFDRMLASEDELQKAREESNQSALFADPESIGMSAEEAQRYREAVQGAHEAASEEMTSRIMQEFEREKSRVWNAERQKVRGQVGEEADGDATLRARSLIQRGKLPSGADAPEGFTPFKLDRVALKAQYPSDIVGALHDRLSADPGGAHGVVHPVAAADMLGFDSADDMLKSLASSDDPRSWIERKTNERMRSRKYDGTPLKSMDIPVEARKAVHNEKRAQLLQLELQKLASTNLAALKGLTRRIARRLPPLKAVRDEAESIVNSKTIRNVKPDVYRRAEAKAAKEAMEQFLKGDLDAAFEQKQKELLNHELYRAASNARDAVTSGVKFMKRFNDDGTRARLGKAGANYLAQIDNLMHRFDFDDGVTRKDLDSRQSLREFIEEQRQLGLTPDLPDDVMNEAFSKSYKELTMQEFTDVVSGAKLLNHLASLKNRLLASDRARRIDEAANEITSKIAENYDINKAEPIDLAPDLTKRIQRGTKGLIAAHTKMEFLFERLDGNTNNGPVWGHLFEPLAKAEGDEHVMMKDITNQVNDIFSAYSRAERATWFYHRTKIDGIDMSMTKASILAVGLNWGNEGNRRAIMDGYGWTEEQVGKILSHLDSRDAQTIGRVWQLIDSFWPQIAKLETELNGVAPEKVEPSPTTIGGLELKGGYYPLIFDNSLSWRQSVLDTRRQAAELFGGQWARAATRQGHTEERTGSGGKPPKLNLSPLSEHLTNVVHDLTHRRAVIDLSRLTQRDDVRQAIENSVGRDMYRQIHPWLVNVAAGERTGFYNPIEGLLARGRAGATVVSMGWKLTTSILQLHSISTATKEIGSKYMSLGMSDVWAQPWKLRSTWDFVTSRSPFMDDRMTSFDRDIRDTMHRMNIGGVEAGALSPLSAMARPVRDSFFLFTGLTHMASALPSWMGAYRKAMDGAAEGIDKGDEPSAIAYADKIIRESQSTGAPKDLATVQRGPEAYKIFTMFYSYFSVMFNQFAKSGNQLRLDKNVGKYAASMALLWFAPAAMAGLVTGQPPDLDADKDEWLKWLAKTEGTYPFQSVILLRDIVNGMANSGYSPSAALDMFGSITKVGQAAGKVIHTDGDIDRTEVKAAALAAGYITKLPSRQLFLTGEYLYDWLTGDQQPDNPIEAAWRGLVTGEKKP